MLRVLRQGLATRITSCLAIAMLCSTGFAQQNDGPTAGPENESETLDPSEGILGTAQPLLVRRARWTVTTDGPAYQATLDVSYRNPRQEVIEAVCYLPMPAFAVERGFIVDNGGVRMEGKVRSRDRALRTYGRITRPQVDRPKDPAILERLNDEWLRSTIAPVGPSAQVNISISFVGLTERNQDLRALHLPVPLDGGTEGRPVPCQVVGRIAGEGAASLLTPDQTLTEHIRVQEGYRFVSRSSMDGNGICSIYFEDRDTRNDVNVHSFFVPQADEHGYFVAEIEADELLATPLEEANYLFVCERPGRGQRHQWKQATTLAEELITKLSDRHHLEILNENGGVFGSLQPADEEHRNTALRALKHASLGDSPLVAQIRRALLLAEANPRPTRLIVISSATILAESANSLAPTLERMASSDFPDFSLVGLAVGASLNDSHQIAALDQLEHHGHGRVFSCPTSAHLSGLAPGFFAAAQYPVLHRPQVTVAGAIDLLSEPPSALTHGQTFSVVGRYSRGGPTLVRLQGNMARGACDEMFSAVLATMDARQPWVATFWGHRRIQTLWSTFDEPDSDELYYVTRLGERFGILGPATVSLALEPDMAARMPQLVGVGMRGEQPDLPLARPFDATPPVAAAADDRGWDARSLATWRQRQQARASARTAAARPPAAASRPSVSRPVSRAISRPAPVRGRR